jgi:hypothetical protein
VHKEVEGRYSLDGGTFSRQISSTGSLVECQLSWLYYSRPSRSRSIWTLSLLERALQE